MPRKAVDYSKTVIYKIVCNDLNVTDIYVGHTTQFTKRKSQHKHCCNNKNSKKHNLKLYQIIRENCGWSNWDMIQIEEYPCSNSNEAGARERYWYETLNAKLNICVPNRSDKEYKNMNREIINEKQKYKFNCECGGKYTKCHKSEHIKNEKHLNFIQKMTCNQQTEQPIVELDLVC